jgi:hypothetical protein
MLRVFPKKKKIRFIEDRFNIRTTFKTEHTLRGVLIKTGPVGYAQQTKQGLCSIPCDYGKTGKPSKVRIKEHKYNLTQGLLENPKLPQYA